MYIKLNKIGRVVLISGTILAVVLIGVALGAVIANSLLNAHF